MNITTKDDYGSGQTFQVKQRVIVVHDGSRGPTGRQGEDGDKGDQGDSIVIRGTFTLDTVYCPLDAVTARSTASEGIQSLFIQKTTVPCSQATVEPYLDPARWDEIGPTDLSNVTGSIWEIYQLNHEFTDVGTPVAFSSQAAKWVKADARMADEMAIAVVREVIDQDRALLQSTGEVPYIDPAVIWPDGSDWEPGKLYYVSSTRGRVEVAPPTQPDTFNHPILMPTRYHEATLPDPGTGAHVGVVLPWAPVALPSTSDYIPVGQKKFFFDVAGGETSLTGDDKYGNTLEVQPAPNTEVFVNGANLEDTVAFTISGDGLTIDFTSPLPAGVVEIWTPDRPLDLLVPSTHVRLDDISASFNGANKVFALTTGGVPVNTTDLNVLIWLDAVGQEGLVDYAIIPDPGNPGMSAIDFTYAPEEGTRFWGTLFAGINTAVDIPPLPQADYLYYRLDAATGVQNPVNPDDGGDPFDSLTSALHHAIQHYSEINYLYVEAVPGTYNEEGTIRWDPTAYVGDMQIPYNIQVLDVWGTDDDPDTTIFNITGWWLSHTAFHYLGGLTINSVNVIFAEGLWLSGPVKINVSSSVAVYRQFELTADLAITSDTINSLLYLQAAHGGEYQGGNLTLDTATAKADQIVVDMRYGSHWTMDGDITALNADPTAKLVVDTDATFSMNGTLTGLVLDEKPNSGVLQEDLQETLQAITKQGSWLQFYVDATLGVQNPIDPVGGDPFDSITSVFHYAVLNYSEVQNLYITVEPGTYNEEGNVRWDPSSWPGNLTVPNNVADCDITGNGATAADVVIDLTGPMQSWGDQLTLSGLTLNAQMLQTTGLWFGGDVIYNQIPSGQAWDYVALNIIGGVAHFGAALTINTDTTASPVIALSRCAGGRGSTGDITVNIGTPSVNRKVFDCQRGATVNVGSVVVAGADPTERLEVQYGATFYASGSVTGLTVNKLIHGGVLREDLEEQHLPEYTDVYFKVDAATGVAEPANPHDGTDPFDSITSVVAWIRKYTAYVQYVYLEIEPGTYNEEGSIRWQVGAAAGDFGVPNNIGELDLAGLGDLQDPSDVVINIGSWLYSNGAKLYLSGLTLNAEGLSIGNGMGVYRPVNINPARTNGVGVYLRGFFDVFADLIITQSVAGTTGVLSCVGVTVADGSAPATLTLDCVNGTCTKPMDIYRVSYIDWSGAIVVQNADPGAQIPVREGSIYRNLGTLTGATINRAGNSGVYYAEVLP